MNEYNQQIKASGKAKRGKRKIAETVAVVGVMAAFAAILCYIEALIPFNIWIPGVKLGLANIAVVVVVYMYGIREALAVNIVRILVVGFLFGNMFSIIYSFCGALLSLAVMCLLQRLKGFSVIGVSMAGGVFHNLGQLFAAVYLMENGSIMYYFPILMIAGVLTGLLIGIGSREVLKRVPKL